MSSPERSPWSPRKLAYLAIAGLAVSTSPPVANAQGGSGHRATLSALASLTGETPFEKLQSAFEQGTSFPMDSLPEATSGRRYHSTRKSHVSAAALFRTSTELARGPLLGAERLIPLLNDYGRDASKYDRLEQSKYSRLIRWAQLRGESGADFAAVGSGFRWVMPQEHGDVVYEVRKYQGFPILRKTWEVPGAEPRVMIMAYFFQPIEILPDPEDPPPEL